MKTVTSILMIFLLSALLSTVNSAPIAVHPNKIPLQTRTAKIFSELEVELINALKANNQARLKSLLADGFEMQQATHQNIPTPAAEWLSNSVKEASNYAANIEQMSVHELNQAAVVSFLWNQGPQAAFFVVDVWRQEGENWKLAIRYLSPVVDVNTKIPGFAPNQGTIIDKRY